MQDKTEHTPGPWEASRIKDGGQKGLYVKQPGDKGLYLVKHTFDGIQAEANAKLMAAAPEMYEALKEIVDLFDGLMHGGFQKLESFTLKPARLALIKAQGCDSI